MFYINQVVYTIKDFPIQYPYLLSSEAFILLLLSLLYTYATERLLNKHTTAINAFLHILLIPFYYKLIPDFSIFTHFNITKRGSTAILLPYSVYIRAVSNLKVQKIMKKFKYF